MLKSVQWMHVTLATARPGIGPKLGEERERDGTGKSSEKTKYKICAAVVIMNKQDAQSYG
ncbi:hypothetical protein PSTG_01115 [Puccinia striiformis f. sp. tritici PST-78]|uniref:Uncharacterized protein n=1 Tax=Puccinia striiformis f. sp. tritici PST-78 TaxID=1165861 RepID=A0A0L0W2K8_9BASI|nr:hypothetical protein PSTG_01115 [Puccinia striiformis f. sp. tritici PST-78]